MMKLPFPHISRLFSASVFFSLMRLTGKIILWSVLAGLIYVNGQTYITRKVPSYQEVLYHPFSSTLHMNIATDLWGRGSQDLAKREIELAQDLSSQSGTSVLGVSTSPESLLHTWESQPKENKKTYEYWKRIASQLPGYRDALIQAGAYAYIVGEKKEASSYLEMAHNLDPNSQSTNHLLEIIH